MLYQQFAECGTLTEFGLPTRKNEHLLGRLPGFEDAGLLLVVLVTVVLEHIHLVLLLQALPLFQ